MYKFKIPSGTDLHRAIEMIVNRINEIEGKITTQENEDIINNIHAFCTCNADYTGIHKTSCILFGSPVRK